MGNSGKDRNYVSMWFWMFAMLVMALPCIGVVMILIWAFTGENESRKNYFRALIISFLLMAAIWTALMMVGLSPLIMKTLQTWIQHLQKMVGHW